MVQRQEVQTQQVRQDVSVRPAQQINRAVQPISAEGEINNLKRVSGILDGLSNFVDTSSEVAFKQAQIDVENKKIVGMSTAISGGKLGEKATKSELMGYELVQSQSDLMKANEQLAQTIQQNPDMPEKDFNKLKEDTYGEVLAKYQGSDPDVFKAISVKAQESQGTLYGIQQQAQKQQRDFKAEETLNYNIGATLDSARTMEQGQQLIDQYMNQGKAMGLSEPKVKDMLFNQMKLTASAGDNRLLKFIESTDWGKYAPDSQQASKLYKAYQKQAQTEFEAAQQKANVFAYGAGLADLERAAKAGASDAELQQMMQGLQAKGLKFTPSTVASYMTMGATVNKSQVELMGNVSTWQANKGNFNLAQNPYIQPADKTKVLEAAESAIVTSSQDVPENERGNFVISNLFRLSAQEGLPVKTITTALTSLANVDPQAPFSPSVQTWTKYLLSADDQTIRMNVPSEADQKMLFGMRDVLINNQGSDAELALKTALSRGQMVRDNKVPLSTQQNKQIQTKAVKASRDFDDPTAQTFYFAAKSVPTSTKDVISNQINDRAKSLYSVTLDTEKAVDIATKEYRKNNMVLTGGILANIGINQLAGHVPDLANKGDDAATLQKRAVSALDYQIGNTLTAQSKSDGIEYKREDARVIFSNSGETYQVNVGGLTVGTFFTKGLKEQYNEEFYSKWDAEQTKQQTKSSTFRAIKESEEFKMPYQP